MTDTTEKPNLEPHQWDYPVMSEEIADIINHPDFYVKANISELIAAIRKHIESLRIAVQISSINGKKKNCLKIKQDADEQLRRWNSRLAQ